MKTAQLAVIHELKDIALRMRERQEQIDAGVRQVHAGIGDLVQLASEQGRDCVLAKTKLGNHLRWSEWLHAHVPNLVESDADKFERLSREQITSVRQAAFAFLPAAERTKTEVPRIKAASWESAWSHVAKLRRIVERDIKTWPASQLAILRDEIEPLAHILWPDGL